MVQLLNFFGTTCSGWADEFISLKLLSTYGANAAGGGLGVYTFAPQKHFIL